MKIHNIILIFSLVFSSCGIDYLDPDELGNYQNKLVVNGIMQSGMPFSFQLTNSKASFSDEFPGLVLSNNIELFRNTTEHNITYNATEERYESDVIPQPGDLFTLKFRIQGYPFASAITRIPEAINAIATLIPEGGRDTSGTLSDLLKIQFDDQVGVRNYYRINFYYYNETLAEFITMGLPIDDPSLAEYNSLKLNDGSILFNDELFDGKTKVLSVVAPFGLVIGNPGDKYLIKLESISNDLYTYYRSLQRAKDAGEGDFSSAFNNAVVIYSNVDNGLGIVGASYAVNDTLR